MTTPEYVKCHLCTRISTGTWDNRTYCKFHLREVSVVCSIIGCKERPKGKMFNKPYCETHIFKPVPPTTEVIMHEVDRGIYKLKKRK